MINIRKTFITSVILFGFAANAQQVIVDEKFEKGNELVGFSVYGNANKVLVQKGEPETPTRAEKIKNIYLYDPSGKKEIVFENEEVKRFFRLNETAFSVDAYHVNKGYTKSYKIYVNGKFASNAERWTSFLNDKYAFDITNKKGETSELDLEKDELFISRREIQTGQEQKLPLEKLNTARLLGDDLYVQNAGNRGIVKTKAINYYMNALDNGTFHIITKAFSKDFKKAITYRTIYDMNGKIIKDAAFEVTVPNYYLNFASNANGGGKSYGYSLNINGFHEDTSNGDMYFYGLLTNDPVADVNVKSAGYYVMKFNSKGEKIWESVKAVDDKEFTANINAGRKICYVLERADKIVFSIGIDPEGQYLIKDFMDKSTGKSVDIKKLSFKNEAVKYDNVPFFADHAFAKSEYSLKELKDKFFDTEGIYQLKLNAAYADYIKGVTSKKEVHFRTLALKDGIWLIETDNKNYYKILYFKE